MKKILIAGGDGFIGRNLKEYFSTELVSYDITAPKSKDFDISDECAVKEKLSQNYYDVVIHAAVYNPRKGCEKDPSKELDKNLRMFFNFEKYRDLYGKMLYFGSGAEFDKRRDICMVEEGDDGNGIPVNDYGFYKYIINKGIQHSKNIYNLRVFGLFGKYEDWRKTFISGICCKAVKGLPITIRQNVLFDYLYIDDFCKIVKWFIENDAKYRDYNLVSGKRIDLITLANITKSISGKDIPIYVCTEGLGNEYTASNLRLISEMHNFTFTPIEDAIYNLYRWYLEHDSDIDIYSLLYH